LIYPFIEIHKLERKKLDDRSIIYSLYAYRKSHGTFGFVREIRPIL